MSKGDPIIDVSNVETRFGSTIVHKDISLSINQGEVAAVIGPSGCGKSTLLREIIHLLEPSAGSIKLFGHDVWRCSEEEMSTLRQRFGVLFQNGALFSALNVGENVAVPLREQTTLEDDLINSIVRLRLGLTGLDASVAQRMPSELSGGMRKRVALARALALEPELLFLDEPTSGLDPIGARAFDSLVKTLSQGLGLTVFMVTHDLDSIESIADRLIVLENGEVIANDSVERVKQMNNQWIQEYFSSRVSH